MYEKENLSKLQDGASSPLFSLLLMSRPWHAFWFIIQNHPIILHCNELL